MLILAQVPPPVELSWRSCELRQLKGARHGYEVVDATSSCQQHAQALQLWQVPRSCAACIGSTASRAQGASVLPARPPALPQRTLTTSAPRCPAAAMEGHSRAPPQARDRSFCCTRPRAPGGPLPSEAGGAGIHHHQRCTNRHHHQQRAAAAPSARAGRLPPLQLGAPSLAAWVRPQQPAVQRWPCL
jgi:hypothetical protein